MSKMIPKLQEQAPVQKGHTIIITLDARGMISLNAPLGDKILCMGMLEMAKEAVRDFKAAAPQQLTIAPEGSVPKNPAGGELPN